MKTTINNPAIPIRQFFETYAFWKIVLLITLLFDMLSTIYFMQVDGIHEEMHPLIRYSALTMGPIVGTFLSTVVFKSLTSFLLEIFFFHKNAIYVYIGIICTSTLAGLYNFMTTP